MPYGQAVPFSRPPVHERGENTLTLKVIGDLEFQYNSFIVIYKIKLNIIKTTSSQDHRYCRCTKDSSALEDRTFDKKNLCDLEGALGFSLQRA